MPAFVLIEVPYHMALEAVGVGCGPAQFLRAGADRALSTGSVPAQVVQVRRRDEMAWGLDAVADLNSVLRSTVCEVIKLGGVPVVLAGNCNTALGTIAGIMDAVPRARTGIVWLDAHGDFNTPETSLSGMLDGMALAVAVGHCHHELRQRIGMAHAVPEENALLLGWRDLDPDERVRLDASRLVARDARNLGASSKLLAALGRRADAVYLHIDVDFLDPAESPGVNFRGPGGVPLVHAEQLIAEVARTVPIVAATLANHNPEHDPDRLTAAAGLGLLSTLAAGYLSRAPR